MSDVLTVWSEAQGAPTMNVVKEGATLSPREFQRLQNVRIRSGVPECRYGYTAINTTGLSGTLNGSVLAQKFTLSGTRPFYQIVPVDTGSSTSLYLTTDPHAATPAYSAITAGSGKYGDTTLLDTVQTVMLSVRDTTNSALAPFSGKAGIDLLVASDGTKVVVYDFAAGEAAVHRQVSAPSNRRVSQEASFPESVSLATGNIAVAVSDADVTATENATYTPSGGTTVLFAYSVATDDNDYGEIVATTGAEVFDGEQFVVFYDADSDRVWDYIQIQARVNAGTWRTVYDPNGGDLPYIAEVEGDVKMAAFDIDRNAVPTGTYTEFRFVYSPAVAGALPATLNLYIFALCGGGTVPGGWQYTVSNFCSGSRAESAGIVAFDKGGASLGRHGVQHPANSFTIPVDDNVYYAYDVYTVQPSNTARDQGVDYALVYARPAGADKAFHVASEALATYAGSWSHSGGRVAGQRFAIRVTATTLYGREAPSAFNVPVPAFKAAAATGSRLYVGDARSVSAGGSPGSADVYASEWQYPFRFRDVPETLDGVPVQTSGNRTTLFGESVQAIAVVSSELLEPDSVVIVTDMSVWAGKGPLDRPYRIARVGTRAPRSVVEDKGVVYFLDTDQNIRRVAGSQSDAMSAGTVDGILAGIPEQYLKNVECCVYKDRLHVAYTRGGQTTNNTLLIYDSVWDAWVRDLPPSGNDFASLWVYEPDGVTNQDSHLRYCRAALNHYSYETNSSDDGGTAISILVRTRTLTAPNAWDNFEIGEIGIIADKRSVAGAGLEWNARVCDLLRSQDNVDFAREDHINVIDAGVQVGDTYRVQRWSFRPASSTDAPKGRVGWITSRAYIQIDGPATPGQALYAIVCKMKSASERVERFVQ